MSYNPESTVDRPTPPRSHHSLGCPWPQALPTLRAPPLAAGGTPVLVGTSYFYFGPSAGLPIPDRLAPYCSRPMFPGTHGGDAPPPAHGSGHEEHPHPGAPPGGGCHLLTGRTRYLRPIPTHLRHPTTPPQRTSPPSCPRRLESQPAHRPRCARALYTGDLLPPLQKGSTRSSPTQRSAGVWWCGAILRRFGAWKTLLRSRGRNR
jgi:hypothetical protein